MCLCGDSVHIVEGHTHVPVCRDSVHIVEGHTHVPVCRDSVHIVQHLPSLYHHTYSSGSYCTQNGFSYFPGQSLLYCTHTHSHRKARYTHHTLLTL